MGTGILVKLALFLRQVVDAAISESVFNMLEGCVPEFAMHGYDRPPSGSTISGLLHSKPLLHKKILVSMSCSVEAS